MPAPEILAAWSTVADGLAFYSITTQEWANVAKALGDEQLDDLGTLAAVEDDDFKEARDVEKLAPIRKGAFNWLFGAAKLKHGLATTLVQLNSGGAMSSVTSGPRATEDATENARGETEMRAAKPSVPLVAKVKLGLTINQGIDQEIPMLSHALLSKARDRYVQACGDEPLPSCAASDAQLTALQFLLDNRMAPYADFAVFNPYGARVERKLKYVQHFMNSEGQWRATEVPGPSTLEQWKVCWDVFAVASYFTRYCVPRRVGKVRETF